MTDITVLDYRPNVTLDEELADLIIAAASGWPDQQPFTAALVRSMLRPVGLTATTLALHRDASGALKGAAALRWPASLEGSGCLYGPMVHPNAAGAGVAKELLASVATIMAAHPGVRVTTTEIPESRTASWSLFERAGWDAAGTAQLMKRRLPAGDLAETPGGVRSVRPGEYLDQMLAGLVASARPELGYAAARDTYAQWRADARYVSDGLLLAEGPGGLLGVALMYPSTPAAAQQPPAEAVIADLLTATDLDPLTAAGVRAALVAAALRAGAGTGAGMARAVVDTPELETAMLGAGFERVERYRYYTQAAPAHQATACAGSGAYLNA